MNKYDVIYAEGFETVDAEWFAVEKLEGKYFYTFAVSGDHGEPEIVGSFAIDAVKGVVMRNAKQHNAD